MNANKIDIDAMFNQFKDDIIIRAYVSNTDYWNNRLKVKMQITIDDFRNWLDLHFEQGKPHTRLLWYKFIPYIKEFIDYGYHFQNIQQINRFINTPDDVIQQVAIDNRYNITCSAEVTSFEEAKDRNSIYFTIIAEAFEENEDPDANVKARPYPTEIEKKEGQTLDDLINQLSSSKEELLDKALKQYEEDGIKRAEIVDVLYKKNRDAKTTVELCRELFFYPKPTKHECNGEVVTIKFALTKRMFQDVFSAMRNEPVDQAWEEFTRDIIANPNEYLNWDKTGQALSPYALKNNLSIENNQALNVHDAYLDNNGQVLRFFADATLKKEGVMM